MADPLDPLLEALRAAREEPDGPVRLATVTGGSSTTINVRFDGEANASSRAYPKTYAPAYVNDRVIMLRTGSTWTAIGRVPQSSAQSPDTGIIPCTPDPNVNPNPYGTAYGTSAQRRNGHVTVWIETQCNINFQVGWGIGNLPAGMAPGQRVWLNCASPFAPHRGYLVCVNENGVLSLQHAVPQSEVLLGAVTYPVA